MQIKTVKTLKSIFDADMLLNIFDQEPVYILVNNNELHWTVDLTQQLNTIVDKNKLLAISLIITHSRSPRVDSITLICLKKNLTPTFYKKINEYVNECTQSNMIGFLKEQWLKNNSKYPLTFMWTTRLDCGYTLIADRAVAPAYQRKGLMKTVSLELIKHLERVYGSEHELKSIAIHPATYLFFNPHDKELKHYNEGTWQEMSCNLLLRMYDKKNTNTPCSISPDMLAALIAQGFLKTLPVDDPDFNTDDDLDIQSVAF